MFFFLPISHDEHSVRRWPIVTIAIALICLFAHLMVTAPRQPAETEAREALTTAVQYYLQHPYLEPGPKVAELAQPLVEAWKQLGEWQEVEPPVAGVSLQQKRLDALEQDYVEALNQLGGFLGLVPGDFQLGDLLGHIFLHGGWIHLLGNLLLLWLVGPALEDRWGRTFYGVFYLLAGMVAGLVWVAAHSDSSVPLVGASGAIAGLMGAFAWRHWSTRIQLMFVLILPPLFLRRVFGLPTWGLLGFWFVGQVLSSFIIARLGIVGGVAYSVHVAGFMFGLLAALAIQWLQLEEKVFRPAIDQALGTETHAELAEAHKLIDQGKPEAWDLLENLIVKNPNDGDAAMTLWSLAEAQGQQKRAAPAMCRYLRAEFQRGDRRLALDQWDDLASQVPNVAPDLPLRLAVVKQYMVEGQRHDAAALLNAGAAQFSQAPLRLQAQMAELAAQAQLQQADHWGQAVIARPGLDPETKHRIETALNGSNKRHHSGSFKASSLEATEPLGPAPMEPARDQPLPVGRASTATPSPGRPVKTSQSAPLASIPTYEFQEPKTAPDASLEPSAPTTVTSAPSPTPPPHQSSPVSRPVSQLAAQPAVANVSYKVEQAVPKAWGPNEIVLDIDGLARFHLPFNRLEALAVARINTPRPWLLIDLITIPGNDGSRRILRLSSEQFDARPMVEAGLSPLDAYIQWIGRLTQAAAALPLPTAAATMGRPFAAFSDLNAYSSSVLKSF